MSAMLDSHAAFLAAALCTHALVGYTLGAVLADSPVAGLLGGVAADVDLLFPAVWGFPLVHRGITHTALAAVVAVAIASRRGRRTAVAVCAGYASQLIVDATTPRGVPIAYPVSSQAVGVPIGGHSAPVAAVLWVGCLAVLWRRRYSAEGERAASVNP